MKSMEMGKKISQHERQRENEEFHTIIKERTHLTARKLNSTKTPKGQSPSALSPLQQLILLSWSLFENR
jgi:hypothetical protein